MDNLKRTFRIKIEEAQQLKEKAFEITKKALVENHQIIYSESSLIHFLINNYLEKITIDENGLLIIKEE